MDYGMIKLLDFLCRLEKCRIHYRIEHNRDDSIMVMPDVPGQRWEVEFFADGHVDIEVFKSDGEIRGEADMDRFFKEFAD